MLSFLASGPAVTGAGMSLQRRHERCFRMVAEEETMTSSRQRSAARRNVKKAAAVARRKRTIAKLPKRVRTALGKQANKVKRQRAR